MGSFPLSDDFFTSEPNAQIIFYEARRNHQLREILDSFFDREIAPRLEWPLQVGDRGLTREFFGLLAKSCGVSKWELNCLYDYGGLKLSPDGQVIELEGMFSPEERLPVGEHGSTLPM